MDLYQGLCKPDFRLQAPMIVGCTEYNALNNPCKFIVLSMIICSYLILLLESYIVLVIVIDYLGFDGVFKPLWRWNQYVNNLILFLITMVVYDDWNTNLIRLNIFLSSNFILLNFDTLIFVNQEQKWLFFLLFCLAYCKLSYFRELLLTLYNFLNWFTRFYKLFWSLFYYN